MFANCAVDETLARCIWPAVSRAKEVKPLQVLKLWTTGGGSWGNGSNNDHIPPVVDKLSRSWLIERVLRDDKKDDDDGGGGGGGGYSSQHGERDAIVVMELGQRARERRDAEWTAYHNSWPDKVKASDDESDVKQVFRRIWPGKEERCADWRDDWQSLPLQA